MKTIFLDFETKSLCNLKKSGAFRYAEDKTTDIICMVAIEKDTTNIYCFTDDIEIYIYLSAISQEKIHLVVHNSMFEYAILRRFFPTLNYENIRYIDTQVLAFQLGLPPSLEKLPDAIKISQKKNPEGKYLINKYSKPNKKGQLNNISSEMLQKIVDYCVQDVKTTQSCFNWFMDRGIKTHKENLYKTLKMNEVGMPVDLSLIKAMVTLRDAAMFVYEDEVKDLGILNPNSPAQIKKYCASKGVEIESIAKEKVDELLLQDNLPKNVRTLLAYRQKASLTSLKKLDTASNSVCSDRTIKGGFAYHGAITGRDAGRLIQPQNIPRGDTDYADAPIVLRDENLELTKMLYGEPLNVIKNNLRSMFYCPTGFYVGDFSAIEARVLLWLCNDPVLADFAAGIDIYKQFAATIYKKPIEDITEDERRLGKTAILGLGFGSGPDKFRITCKSSYGIDLPEIDMENRIVESYRKKFIRVVNFWKGIQKGFRDILRGRINYYESYKISIQLYKDIMRLKLPSGREIYYNKIDIDQKGDIVYWRINAKTKKWEAAKTYGGRLVENVTQAVAYDLMLYAFNNLLKEITLVGRVHDEIIALKNDNVSLDRFKNIMEQIPKWATDISLAVDASEMFYYNK